MGNPLISKLGYSADNARALRELQADERVEIRRFDDAMLRTFAEISRDVVSEAGSGDRLARRIYRSYLDFRSLISAWSSVAEGSYLGIRHFG
jgi:TRAP-type mannitol/chloroaromatic compound transport system substrate-binding protein